MSALLPLGQDERAHDGNENEKRREFERVNESSEEQTGKVARGGEGPRGFGIRNRSAMLGHGSCEQAGERKRQRQAAELRELGKVSPLFFAGVEKHDDEDKQHHDGAAVDDDLHGGDELRS